MSEDTKAWRLLEKIVSESQEEQKKASKWRLIFKILTFLYIGFVLYMVYSAVNPSGAGSYDGDSIGYVSSVEVSGVIADGADADAELLIEGIQLAFADESSKAVLLKINSPGGSPVQSGYVYDEIMRLKKEHPEKKVYAVIEDVGASGAYYIAAAADKIYADKASLVGSIGVISSSFGFVGAMKKFGVERRSYHAGDNKAMLDPFSPEDPKQTAFWQTVLDTTHKQFIEQVKKGRGDRLKPGNTKLFSGLIWSGEQALELGLIDGLGSAESVAFAEEETRKIIDMSVTKDPIETFMSQLGASVGKGIAQAMGMQNTSNLQMR